MGGTRTLTPGATTLCPVHLGHSPVRSPGADRSVRPGGPAPGEARRGRARPRSGRSSTRDLRRTRTALCQLSYQRTSAMRASIRPARRAAPGEARRGRARPRSGRSSPPRPPRRRRGALPTEPTAQTRNGQGSNLRGTLAPRRLSRALPCLSATVPETTAGFEPAIDGLQPSALPLGHAVLRSAWDSNPDSGHPASPVFGTGALPFGQRSSPHSIETAGFEPATSCFRGRRGLRAPLHLVALHSPRGTRTHTPPLRRRLLVRLSFRGIARAGLEPSGPDGRRRAKPGEEERVREADAAQPATSAFAGRRSVPA